MSDDQNNERDSQAIINNMRNAASDNQDKQTEKKSDTFLHFGVSLHNGFTVVDLQFAVIEIAKALNRSVGDLLMRENLSAGSPACAQIMNGIGGLENYIQVIEQLKQAQRQQSGVVVPGMRMPGGPGRIH